MDRARAKQIDTLEAALAKVRGFLRCHEDQVGACGRVKKCNITDPESAKMKTSKGVIQGYTGVAVVDGKHQIVVGAEAFGEGQEHGLLVPMLEHTREAFRELGRHDDVLAGAVVSADAGFHTEENLKHLEATGVDAYVADTLFRKRDPRFATAERHKPAREPDPDRLFGPADFQFDETTRSCICPAGKRLYANGSRIRRLAGMGFPGPNATVVPARYARRCLRNPIARRRQVVFFLGRATGGQSGKCPDEAQDRHDEGRIGTAGGSGRWNRCSPTSAVPTACAGSASGARRR